MLETATQTDLKAHYDAARLERSVAVRSTFAALWAALKSMRPQVFPRPQRELAGCSA